MGPESLDHRVERVGTRSWKWDKTVMTGELGLENWTRELGPESWESWDQELEMGQDS